MGQVHTQFEEQEEEEPELNPEEVEARNKKRYQIVREIIQTEKVYVQSLTEISENWERPIRLGNILSESRIRAVFNITGGILCLHQNLMKELEQRFLAWDDRQVIGDIFRKNASALQLYVEYVNRYSTALSELYAAMEEVHEFKKYALQLTNGAPNPGFVLENLLIQPIQRIPRYQLLLQDLVKNTSTHHRDYTDLRVALNKIIISANFINKQKKTYDQMDKMFEANQRKVVSNCKLIPKMWIEKTESGRTQIMKKTISQEHKVIKKEVAHFQPDVCQVIEEHEIAERKNFEAGQRWCYLGVAGMVVMLGTFVFYRSIK